MEKVTSQYLPFVSCDSKLIFVTQRRPGRPESASRRIGSLSNYTCAPVEPSSDSEAVEGAAEFLRYLEAGPHNMSPPPAVCL
jgi:hypothetical protein